MKRLLLITWLGLTQAVAATEPTPMPAIWEADIRAFEQQERTAPITADDIVFVGSSSFRLWTDLADDFPNVAVRNRGFGGCWLPDVTHFAPRLLLRQRPRAIVLYAGDNDLAAGRSPTQVAADFDAFLRVVRKRWAAVPIAVVSIKPSPARAALIDAARDANARIARRAAASAHVTYLDVMTPMLDRHGNPRANLFIDDGLHMNRQGYAIWRERIGRWIDTLPPR